MPDAFDLIEHARTHRYRTHNLHDGRPCPPCRLDKRRRTREELAGEVFRSGC